MFACKIDNHNYKCLYLYFIQIGSVLRIVNKTINMAVAACSISLPVMPVSIKVILSYQPAVDLGL